MVLNINQKGVSFENLTRIIELYDMVGQPLTEINYTFFDLNCLDIFVRTCESVAAKSRKRFIAFNIFIDVEKFDQNFFQTVQEYILQKNSRLNFYIVYTFTVSKTTMLLDYLKIESKLAEVFLAYEHQDIFDKIINLFITNQSVYNHEVFKKLEIFITTQYGKSVKFLLKVFNVGFSVNNFIRARKYRSALFNTPNIGEIIPNSSNCDSCIYHNYIQNGKFYYCKKINKLYYDLKKPYKVFSDYLFYKTYLNNRSYFLKKNKSIFDLVAGTKIVNPNGCCLFNKYDNTLNVWGNSSNQYHPIGIGNNNIQTGGKPSIPPSCGQSKDGC